MYLPHNPYFQIGFIEIVMNEKAEDRSDESKRNHIAYYKSLNKTIENIQKEKLEETEPTIIKHLNGRIESMNLDKKRIRDMFPEINENS
jgi:Zn/Cd-binding protein ZinT